MKTIDEIVNRSDYVKLNEALQKRTRNIAKIVLDKMRELDIRSIPEYDLRIIKYSCNAGYSDRFLCVVDYDYQDEGYENARSLESSESYYYGGDFNCWIQCASYDDRLNFLNHAKEIFEYLDEIETEKCSNIENALKETKSFVK